MSMERRFWWFWIGGLVIFALLRIPHGPLVIPEVPAGILDHQAAGTAREVDRIQTAWTEAGLFAHARAGMFGDLVFIGVYGLGALFGGLTLRAGGGKALRRIGGLIALAAVIFILTDYVETIAQVIQLLSRRGDDVLAATAAFVQPIKMVAWAVTFLGIIAGLIIRRATRKPA